VRLNEFANKYLGKAHTLSLLLPEKGRGMIYFGLGVVVLVVLMALAAPLLTPFDPTKSVGRPFLPPSFSHPMGTNKLGMDMWSRAVYGARTILYVVFLALVVSMSVGIPVGLLSGYYGGGLDRGLSLIMDAIYAFPSLVLAIALAVALGPSLMNAAISIAVVYVPTYFRMVRGQVLSIKAEQFIEEAKVLGLPTWRILFKHIFPHLLPTIMVVFSLNAADAVLTEAGLSFLGLSVQFPTPDWGYDLNVGRGFMLSGYWWLVMFPGLMITLLAIGFALIGEGLSERVRKEVI
jgi:peptide/nickel transport system permease protein